MAEEEFLLVQQDPEKVLGSQLPVLGFREGL
jgi:hypothetical protein